MVTSSHSFICNAVWLYFFILFGLVIIFLLLILEAGPVDHPHLALLSAPILGDTKTHRFMPHSSMCICRAELYLGVCLLKEGMRKTAADQITNVCSVWQYKHRTNITTFYNNHSLLIPLSHNSTSTNSER